jgi:ABC-type Fe3+ transport system permease subunit
MTSLAEQINVASEDIISTYDMKPEYNNESKTLKTDTPKAIESKNTVSPKITVPSKVSSIVNETKQKVTDLKTKVSDKLAIEKENIAKKVQQLKQNVIEKKEQAETYIKSEENAVGYSLGGISIGFGVLFFLMFGIVLATTIVSRNRKSDDIQLSSNTKNTIFASNVLAIIANSVTSVVFFIIGITIILQNNKNSSTKLKLDDKSNKYIGYGLALAIGFIIIVVLLHIYISSVLLGVGGAQITEKRGGISKWNTQDNAGLWPVIISNVAGLLAVIFLSFIVVYVYVKSIKKPIK